MHKTATALHARHGVIKPDSFGISRPSPADEMALQGTAKPSYFHANMIAQIHKEIDQKIPTGGDFMRICRMHKNAHHNYRL
jgi:hypothetical protein